MAGPPPGYGDAASPGYGAGVDPFPLAGAVSSTGAASLVRGTGASVPAALFSPASRRPPPPCTARARPRPPSPAPPPCTARARPCPPSPAPPPCTARARPRPPSSAPPRMPLPPRTARARQGAGPFSPTPPPTAPASSTAVRARPAPPAPFTHPSPIRARPPPLLRLPPPPRMTAAAPDALHRGRPAGARETEEGRNEKAPVPDKQGALEDEEEDKAVSPKISDQIRSISNSMKLLNAMAPSIVKQKIDVQSNQCEACSTGIKAVSPKISDQIRSISNSMKLFNAMAPSIVKQKIDVQSNQCEACSTGIKESLAKECLMFLNSATKEELKSLKGIGDKRANFILELREESPEPFKEIDDLKNIMGMNKKEIIKMVSGLVLDKMNEEGAVSDRIF